MEKLFQAKNIPNALGWLRIVLCAPVVVLAFFEPYMWHIAMPFYMLSGFTDMIDGTLARHIKGAQSEYGAKLDSIADMVLVFTGILCVLPKIVDLSWGGYFDGGELWGWLFIGFICALMFRNTSDIVGRIKHKETVMLHTYSTKVLGAFLFFSPIFYYFLIVVAGLGSVTIMALNILFAFDIFLVAVIISEEIAINLMLIKPARNIRSIFGVKRANEETRRQQQKEQK